MVKLNAYDYNKTTKPKSPSNKVFTRCTIPEEPLVLEAVIFKAYNLRIRREKTETRNDNLHLRHPVDYGLLNCAGNCASSNFNNIVAGKQNWKHVLNIL